MSRQQRAAADWAALMRGTPSEADREAFDAWSARPGNADAYARAVDDWTYSAGVSRQRVEAKARGEARVPGSLRWAAATIAALGLAIGFAFYLQNRSDERQIAAAPTQPGPLRLADGTIVTLMDGARIDPQLSTSERRIVLNGGRARFNVAHEPARPFIVIAGGSETRAIGTVFEIDAREGVPRIKLLQGSVEVRANGAGQTLRLVPGETAEVPASGPRRVPAIARPVPTTMLAADNLPLGAIVERANSANDRHIALADPALAALQVTGRFNVSDSSALARKLAVALALDVDDRADAIVLSKK